MKYNPVLEDLTGKKKRGRKPGSSNLYSVRPECYSCGETIGNHNLAGRRYPTGKPVNLCKECAREYQIKKIYRRRPLTEIKERISWHLIQIEILKEVWREKED